MKRINLVYFLAIGAAVFFSLFCAAQEGGVMKAIMIIAPADFRDEELFEPKKILEEGGVNVTVASRVLGEVKGTLGGKIIPDIKVDNVKADDYDAIIFVGGGGAQCYWDDPVAHALIRDAHNAGKIIAAICIAPVILANAGILENRKTTVFPSDAKYVQNKKALYTGNALEKDGNIITASGPAVAKQFGAEILKTLAARK